MINNEITVLDARNKRRSESCSSQASSASARIHFFDFFSGIGGFRIGLERAGFKCIGSCEIDKYASLLYKTYFNTEKELEPFYMSNKKELAVV